MGDLSISKYRRSSTDGSITFGPYGQPHPNGWGVRYVYGDFASWIEGRIINRCNYVENDINALKPIALINAYVKMNETPVMAGEILSDLGKTIGMLRKPFASAQKLAHKILSAASYKMSKKAARSQAEALASSWLEYRYGWKPLMGDIFTIMLQGNEIITKAPKRRLVARSSAPRSGKISDQQRISGGLPSFNAATVEVISEVSGVAAAGVIYEVKLRNAMESFMAGAGLRLNDVPVTLWNITPFSFVWDWFQGVGSWLTAITPNPDVDILGTWCTTVIRKSLDLSITAEATLGPSTPYPAQTWYGNGGHSTLEWEYITREVNPVLASTPQWNPDLPSIVQLTDASALFTTLTSALGRCKH